MKVLIVGGGDIGRELARDLLRRKENQVVLVELDPARCESLAAEYLDALVIQGDGSDPARLQRAGIADADALVATTGSDALNTVIAFLAHQQRVAKIVVKLNSEGMHAACQEIGVTAIITPKIAAAARVVSVLHGLHHLDFSVVARGGLELIELPVGRAAGRRLTELQAAADVLVVAVLRGDQVVLARGPTRLEEGDVLLTLVETRGAGERFAALLASPPGA